MNMHVYMKRNKKNQIEPCAIDKNNELHIHATWLHKIQSHEKKKKKLSVVYCRINTESFR